MLSAPSLSALSSPGACSTARPSRRQVATQAFFTKAKKAAPVVVEEPPKKKASFFGRKAAKVVEPPPAPAPKKASFFSKKAAAAPAKDAKASAKTVDKAQEYKKRQGLFGGVISSLDFAEVRSASDAELLYEAKYGKLDNGRLSAAQAAALRRKVGGTAKDFWKDSVDVKGEYTDKGYVAADAGPAAVPALPFLVGIVLALLATTGYVVSQTGGAH